LIVLLCSTITYAQEQKFALAKCTIVSSLGRSANQYFAEQVAQLDVHLVRKNIRIIDLNNWHDNPPYLRVSGRERAKLRTRLSLPSNVNQAILLDERNQVLKRFSGTVNLVDVILSCDEN
jgi:hypothetical protein